MLFGVCHLLVCVELGNGSNKVNFSNHTMSIVWSFIDDPSNLCHFCGETETFDDAAEVFWVTMTGQCWLVCSIHLLMNEPGPLLLSVFL